MKKINFFCNQSDLDFKVLNKVNFNSDDILISVDTIDIDFEITNLIKDLSTIDLDLIPFNRFDFVIIYLAGLIGASCDIIIGKPSDGYKYLIKSASEPKINNNFAFGLGSYLKKYDLKNNPIDKTIPGISVGDHRLYSYGHDLLRVMQTVKLMLLGTGPVGFVGTGGELVLEQAPEKWLESLESLGISGSNREGKTIVKILIILFLHLYKDYCSARSLPIPGMSYIAKLNKDRIPEFLDELINKKELNLRTLNGQTLSVISIEIIISIYIFIIKKTDNNLYSEEKYQNKKEILLFYSNSIAISFNLGKVLFTGNPAFLNFPQIIRIVNLSRHVMNGKLNFKNNAVEKINISALKNQLELTKTLIFLEKSIIYTNQSENIILELKKSFDNNNSLRKDFNEKGFQEINSLIEELKKVNEAGGNNE